MESIVMERVSRVNFEVYIKEPEEQRYCSYGGEQKCYISLKTKLGYRQKQVLELLNGLLDLQLHKSVTRLLNSSWPT